MPKLPKIKFVGTDAAAVEVTGDPRNQEPTHVRICFPGGELELVRAADGPDADYWCHIRVVQPTDHEVLVGVERPARVSDARIDLKSKSASECDAGDLRQPDMYHLAVRVTRAAVAAPVAPVPRPSPTSLADEAAAAAKIGNHAKAAQLYREASGACIGHGRGRRLMECAEEQDALVAANKRKKK